MPTFSIVSITPMYRVTEPHFASATAEVKIPHPELDAFTAIDLNVKFVFEENDTMRDIQEKVLLAVREVLSKASELTRLDLAALEAASTSNLRLDLGSAPSGGNPSTEGLL